MNKEELGSRYYEVKSVQLLTYLLRKDKDALWRVLNKIKVIIQQEEAGEQAIALLERVKRKQGEEKR